VNIRILVRIVVRSRLGIFLKKCREVVFYCNIWHVAVSIRLPDSFSLPRTLQSYCPTLPHTLLHTSAVLASAHFHTATHYLLPHYHTLPHFHTATNCYTTAQCSTLYHTLLHRRTLLNTAEYTVPVVNCYNTLLHTDTHCNYLLAVLQVLPDSRRALQPNSLSTFLCTT